MQNCFMQGYEEYRIILQPTSTEFTFGVTALGGISFMAKFYQYIS